MLDALNKRKRGIDAKGINYINHSCCIFRKCGGKFYRSINKKIKECRGYHKKQNEEGCESDKRRI